MQIIRYKDPYAKARNGSPVDIIIEEDMPPERLREVQDYLNEDFTRVRSSMRKYERHNLSLESRLYEGPDFSYRKTPEWVCLRKEQREEMAAALASLTETQYRRFGMLCDGLSVREIARIEEADYKSVRESIEAARKKLRCAIESCTFEEPDFDCHPSKHKHRKNGDDTDPQSDDEGFL